MGLGRRDGGLRDRVHRTPTTRTEPSWLWCRLSYLRVKEERLCHCRTGQGGAAPWKAARLTAHAVAAERLAKYRVATSLVIAPCGHHPGRPALRSLVGQLAAQGVPVVGPLPRPHEPVQNGYAAAY